LIDADFSFGACQIIRKAMERAGLTSCALDSSIQLAARPGDEQSSRIAEGRRMSGVQSNWPSRCILSKGAGIVATDTILPLLQSSGFEGWLSYEWEKKWLPHLADPETALPRHIQYLRELMKTL
jgi:hypothetical protein